MTDPRDLNLLAVDTETTGFNWFDDQFPFIATVSDREDDEVYDLTLQEGRLELRRDMFLVDGFQWVTDPQASHYSDDGFGNRNAVLAVADPET